MHRHRSVAAFALTAVVVSLLSGCFPGDVGVTLIPSTKSLDFGAAKTSMTLDVSRNVTTTPGNPLVVSSSVDWVIPGACLDTSENCMVNSTMLPVRIPVTIRRDLLTLGTNRAKLYLSAGPSSQVEVDVIADDRIQSDFTADERSVGLGRPVVFRDLSVSTTDLGPISSWLWNFGDGTTSTDQNPTHLYTVPGTFDVSLTVKAGGAEETLKRAGYVKVDSPQLVVDFVASSTNVAVNGVVSFTDLSSSTATPVTNWRWDFGDGVVSADRNPYHQYNTPGLYTVSLTVSTQFGDMTKTKQNYINVRQKIGPTANFAVSDVKPFVNTPTRFTDLSDPGTSPITNWVWEFGDLVIVNDQNPVHAYAKVGTYNVKLTVFTEEGVSSKTMPVVVDYKPPTADFVTDTTSPSVNQSVVFTDRSQPGSNTIIAWAWDFGDKSTSTLQNPLHAYTKEGTYTVKLTVRSKDPSNNENTVVKENYITVIQPPTPDFSWTPRLALTDTSIDFNGTLTVPGTEPITSYSWDFDGDPDTTTDVKVGPAAVYKYTKPGVYNVALTVRTATRAVTASKAVTVDRAPSSDFTATPTTGITSDDIQFTPVTQASGVRPITGYLWSFGDGATSTERRPKHRYAAQGSYKVKLTVYFRHSASLPTDDNLSASTEKPGYVNITAPTPPAVTFKSTVPCPVTNMGVEFVLTSYSSPTRPITKLEWDFGDGTAKVSQTVSLSTSGDPAPDPVPHTYATAGEYQVTVTATAAALDPADGVRSFTLDSPLAVIDATALDTYVRSDDGAYNYTLYDTRRINYENTGVKIADAYIIQMTSQVWHAADVYSPADAKWRHYLVLFNPVERLTDTALLYVDGGSNPDFNNPAGVPNLDDLNYYAIMSAIAGSPMALLKTVPSEPIIFNDEVFPGDTAEEKLILRERSEDEIIAYTYNKYMEQYTKDPATADTTWPLLFPMAKAAVKAMDTIQELSSNPDVGIPRPVKDFVVSGGSKRGWTTWMTGITDCRLKGIAPIVIDVLNMDKQMIHHRACYGYWAPSVYPYAQERVFDRMMPGASAEDQAAATALLELVDPYRYLSKDRLEMPKLVTTASRDEFFLPDAAQFYFHDLPGEARLNTLPNRSHGIYTDGSDPDPNDPDDPAGRLLAWFMSVSQDKARPNFNWTFTADGSIRVTVDAARKPKTVKMWYATSKDKRDFRITYDGSGQPAEPIWRSQVLLPETTGGNTYLVSQPVPEAGSYTAYFAQLIYANTASLPSIITNNPALGITVPDLVFTSEVKVIPQNSDGTNLYPNFVGYVANDPGNTDAAVRFGEDTAPVVVLYGSATQMGTDYGELMATQIAEFIPNYVNSYLAAYPTVTTAILDSEWSQQALKVDSRITDEMDGIIAGLAKAGVTSVTLQDLRRAHMVALRDCDTRNGASGQLAGTGAAAGAWRSRTLYGDTLHAFSMNGSAQLSWPTVSGTRYPQDYRCIVMYIPESGVPHALLTFAGLTISRTGVNVGGITWSDQIVTLPVTAAVPANLGRMFLGRKVLYEALNLQQAEDRIAAPENLVERACQIVVTDGRNYRRGAYIQAKTNGAPVIIHNQSAIFDSVTPKTAGMVRVAAVALNGTDYDTALRGIWGGFDEAGFLDVAADASVTQGGTGPINLLNTVYDCIGFELRINFSYASGTDMAYARPYSVFDMQQLLP